MALIPPFFLDSVVALGTPKAKATNWIASGFLYGHPVDVSVPEEQRQYRPFLVTNRHVFQDQDMVKVRFNPQDASRPAQEFDLTLKQHGTTRWLSHKDQDIDVAVVPVNARV